MKLTEAVWAANAKVRDILNVRTEKNIVGDRKNAYVSKRIKRPLLIGIILTILFIMNVFLGIYIKGQRDILEREKAIAVKIEEYWSGYEPYDRKLTIEDFQNLELGDSMSDITEKIGEPDAWAGYGILRPVFILEDRRTVEFVFTYPYALEELKEIVIYDGFDVDCVLKD